jgi:hypothetical protein
VSNVSHLSDRTAGRRLSEVGFGHMKVTLKIPQAFNVKKRQTFARRFTLRKFSANRVPCTSYFPTRGPIFRHTAGALSNGHTAAALFSTEEVFEEARDLLANRLL